MTIDQVEELIRKYLSMGIAVVVVLIGPVTAASGTNAAPQVITVTPGPTTAARTTTATPNATDQETAPITVTAGAAPTPASATATRSPDTSATTDAYPSTSEAATPTTTKKKEKKHQHDTSTTATSTATTPTTAAPTTTEPTTTEPTTTEPESGEPTDTTGPTTTAGPPAGPSARTSESEGTTAAAAFGWGEPVRQDGFTGDLAAWGVYDGPGHAGQGVRSPGAATVRNGVLTITGDAEGTTAGMAWKTGQKYGRWEGRVKAPAGDPSYNALMLLWPDAENFPEGGEVDFMEMTDPTRQSTNLFVHHGAENAQLHGQVAVDATQWHNWAVEWTPKGITTFVDGKRWWHTDDTSVLPPGPMHLCLQLDWFPKNAKGAVKASQMQVDWVRQYSLDGGSGGGSGGGTDPTANAEPSSTDTTANAGRGSVMRAVIQRMFGW